MRKSFFSLIGLFLMTFVFTGCGESVKESQAQKEAAEKARHLTTLLLLRQRQIA